ncbi:MAG: rapid alkalinization factor family protein [Myxococcota bacterium]|nr:rapid alkalinization factor family protein [Myxococcota bacterium]
MKLNTWLFASIVAPGCFLVGCSGADPSADVSSSAPSAISGDAGPALGEGAVTPDVTPEGDAGAAGPWKTEQYINYWGLGGDRAACPSGQVKNGNNVCVPAPSPNPYHRGCTAQTRCGRG